MKIALILSANLKLSPYVEIFRKILIKNKIDFDIISWDRESLDENEGIVFKFYAPNTRSQLGKLSDYYKFNKFVTKQLTDTKYDKLILFGAAIGVFMYDFLNKHYRNKFWFDYRDLTIEQKFKKRFKRVCDISAHISISSPGFASAFPAQYNFILSHNFDIDEVRKSVNIPLPESDRTRFINHFRISTIGAIRDYSANVDVIDSLKNNPEFDLWFIGRGPQSDPLHQYVLKNDITNVFFEGFYQKQNEWKFYEQADLINIYYPRIQSHDTALSNRFYKSMIFRKPMIVTNNSTQAYYVEKYKLGLSIEDCSLLPFQIKQFMGDFDVKLFNERCSELLNEFISDYNRFEVKLLEFVKNE